MDPIVWFDTETSGLDPNKHQIIQFAAIAQDDENEEELELKIQFNEEEADAKALEVNRYSREAWKDAVSEYDAVGVIARFLQRYRSVQMVSKAGHPYTLARLAGHNVRFDCEFLRAMFRRHSTFLPADSYRPLDTLQLALWRTVRDGKFPQDYKLGSLLEHFGTIFGDYDVRLIHSHLHDALWDVRATMWLGLKLL